MCYDRSEILKQYECLKLKTLMSNSNSGINILDCRGKDVIDTCRNVVNKIRSYAQSLHDVVEEVSLRFGIPIVNRRLAISPVSLLFGKDQVNGPVELALLLDQLSREIRVDFIGGFTALVQKGITPAAEHLIHSLPAILTQNRTHLFFSQCGIDEAVSMSMLFYY